MIVKMLRCVCSNLIKGHQGVSYQILRNVGDNPSDNKVKIKTIRDEIKQDNETSENVEGKQKVDDEFLKRANYDPHDIHPDAEKDPLKPWPEGKNPYTGEKNGPKGPEPTRYGDWE